MNQNKDEFLTLSASATNTPLTIAPSFPDCDHCIVFCAYDNYIPLTAVAIQSITEHISPNEHYDVLVLHGGIGAEHIKNFNQQWNGITNLRVRFVDIQPFFARLRLYTTYRKTFTQEAYYRLTIPWVLSPKYQKALYLDGATITRHDIAPIFGIDLADTLVGAVRDYQGISDCYKTNNPRRAYRSRIGMNDIDNYVSNASLLFNLKLWRERFTLENVLRLCASRKWLQHDQDVINILCQRQITYLSATWGRTEDRESNYLLSDALLQEINPIVDPVIYHFDHDGLPHIKSYVKYDLEFWKCADATLYISKLLASCQSCEYRNYVAYSINRNGIETVRTATGNETYYKGVALGPQGQAWQRIRVVRINKQVLHLEGAVGFFACHYDNNIKLFLSVNGSLIKAVREYPENAISERLKEVSRGFAFVFEVPLPAGKHEYAIHLKVLVNGKEVPLSQFNFLRYAELSGKLANEYYTNNGWTVKTDYSGNSLTVTRNTPFTILRNECIFLAELVKIKGIRSICIIMVRLFAHFFKFLQRKPIWLITDRMERAGDNGEVFYKYLKENHRKDVNAYFILLPSSIDYPRLKSLGGIISPHSWRHKVLSLLADWRISSQTNYLYRNPIRAPYYRDVVRKTRFAFLQHGITFHDMTSYLDKDVQEIDGLVISTKREYHSFIHGEYHYTSEQIWPTGFPRFDCLEDKREKIVTILPTWRKYLFSGQNHKTGIWQPIEGFEKSDYVTFYRNLLHDNSLRTILNQFGYSLRFLPHPTCLAHIGAFQIPDDIALPENISYHEIYKTSNLIITDYSSAIYDFVYLRKPIVYCQFDADQFFSGRHMCDKCGFDYKCDGFGEVTYNLHELIVVIAKYLETDCALHEPYKSRMEKAFLDREPTHCDRLYNKILEQREY